MFVLFIMQLVLSFERTELFKKFGFLNPPQSPICTVSRLRQVQQDTNSFLTSLIAASGESNGASSGDIANDDDGDDDDDDDNDGDDDESASNEPKEKIPKLI